MQIAYQNYFHKQLSGLFLQSSEKKNGFSFSMKEIAYGMQPFTFTRLMSIYGTIIMSGVHLWCPKIAPAHLVLGQSQLLYIHIEPFWDILEDRVITRCVPENWLAQRAMFKSLAILADIFVQDHF